MKSAPIDPVEAIPLGDSVPVSLERQRHDGWTEARQRVFLFALSETGCVTEAAQEAGVTPRSNCNYGDSLLNPQIGGPCRRREALRLARHTSG